MIIFSLLHASEHIQRVSLSHQIMDIWLSGLDQKKIIQPLEKNVMTLSEDGNLLPLKMLKF
jgi:hypothetical protein